MYMQIIPTIPFCSDYDVQKIRISYEELKKDEEYRKHREKMVYNNKKKWWMSFREHQQLYSYLETEMNVWCKAKWDASSREVKQNGEVRNYIYVIGYL